MEDLILLGYERLARMYQHRAKVAHQQSVEVHGIGDTIAYQQDAADEADLAMSYLSLALQRSVDCALYHATKGE